MPVQTAHLKLQEKKKKLNSVGFTLRVTPTCNLAGSVNASLCSSVPEAALSLLCHVPGACRTVGDSCSSVDPRVGVA